MCVSSERNTPHIMPSFISLSLIVLCGEQFCMVKQLNIGAIKQHILPSVYNLLQEKNLLRFSFLINIMLAGTRTDWGFCH